MESGVDKTNRIGILPPDIISQYSGLEVTITAATGILKAIGTTVHTGKKTGTAEGRLVDSAGALYAHGTTTIILLPKE